MEMGLIVMIMNKIAKFILPLAMCLASVSVFAQQQDPAGSLTYYLPSTVIRLEVEAVQEKFYAGPYAKYAEKYLGIKVRQKDETTYQLTEIKMTSSVEADYSKRYSLVVNNGVIDASFLKLSTYGLVSFGDAAHGNQVAWRFPTETAGNFADKGVSSNITSEATVLYKKDKGNSSRVSVQQNVIVTKSLEQKASETASMILNLRKQRLQIVTGDTDATYSGEAMGAAIEELSRLESEYMTMFVGYSEYQTQKKNFELIPDATRENQRYVAFRLSDSAGLVPADNLSGKPVVMEIVPQVFEQIAQPVPDEKHAKKSKKEVVAPAVLAYYRIPATCVVKLMEGVDVLLQTRMPVYQLGQESSLPVNVILK